MNAGLPDLSIFTLALDSSGNLYAGIYNQRTGGAGVFKLPSGGTTWSALNTGLTKSNIRRLAFDSSGNLYAATNSSVFKLPSGAPVGARLISDWLILACDHCGNIQIFRPDQAKSRHVWKK
jgi:hypothetical protein